jgi:hypothetical protein
MKARTKAKRIASRRTHPAVNRKALPRTPSGALSRSAERKKTEDQMTEGEKKAEAREAMSVALGARQRVHGLRKAAAESVEAGSALGRLFLAGMIPRRLYAAGSRYAEDVWAYHMATGIAHPSARAIDYSRVKGRGMDRSAETVKTITNRYMLGLGAIQQIDKAGRPVETTVRNVVLLDIEARDWPPHMIKLLKYGLTALADRYGIVDGNERERAA